MLTIFTFIFMALLLYPAYLSGVFHGEEMGKNLAEDMQKKEYAEALREIKRLEQVIKYLQANERTGNRPN